MPHSIALSLMITLCLLCMYIRFILIACMFGDGMSSVSLFQLCSFEEYNLSKEKARAYL